MLAATLFGHMRHGAFNNLEQRLLHAFATHVACNRGVFGLAGNLVNFVNVDDAAFGLTHIHPAVLQEVKEDVFHVFTHITCFRHRGGISNCKGHIEHLGEGLCKEGLTATRRANQQHIALFNLDIGKGIILHRALFQPLVVVVHRHRKQLLYAIVADDVLIQKGLNLLRIGHIQLRQRLFRTRCRRFFVHLREILHHLLVLRKLGHHPLRQGFRAAYTHHNAFFYTRNAMFQVGFATAKSTFHHLILTTTSHGDLPKTKQPPRVRWQLIKKKLAEREGFEPPVPCGTHDFESCAFNQALPPLLMAPPSGVGPLFQG